MSMFQDLKQVDLETKLSEIGLNHNEINNIKQEVQYYDKYFLVNIENNIGFIKIWRQYVSDPYMEINIDECDITGFKNSEISAKKFIDVLDEIFEVPQMIRCIERDYENFKSRGFQDIKNKLKKSYRSDISASTLIPVIIKVDDSISIEEENFDKVRLMRAKDLSKIEEIFSKEYAARLKAVRPMFNYDPQSCFVYEENVIKGIVFAEKHKNELYIHQVFIKEEFRGQQIDKTLLNYMWNQAIKLEKPAITGSVRGNLLPYYRRRGLFEDISKPRSIYLIRYALKLR